MGHIATKQELIAILRRFDMDGDAKIGFAEFELGMKSSIASFPNKHKRPRSTTGIKTKKRTLSREFPSVTPRKNASL